MNAVQLQALDEYIQRFVAQNGLHAPDVAGALVELSARNCVQAGINRRAWRDQCAEAFARAQKLVKRNNPAIVG